MTSSNVPRSPFSLARKALWGEDVKWLLDFLALGKNGSKMPHCVAFEGSIQAKNRKNHPKIRFHNFPNDAATGRARIHAVGRISLPKDSRLCSKLFEEHCLEEYYLMEVRLMGSSNSKKSL